MALPADIQLVFFETLYGTRSVLEFEKWLYADKRLENMLPPQDYVDLLSYQYTDGKIRVSLSSLLEKHIDKGQYEKWRLLTQLNRVLERTPDAPDIIIDFYDLYCKGYYFMDNLGLGYGLRLDCPYPDANSWVELTKEQQADVLRETFPAIDVEIKKVIGWLESGKVVLTGIRDEYEHLTYIDNCLESEKQPTAYQRADNNNNAGNQKSW